MKSAPTVSVSRIEICLNFKFGSLLGALPQANMFLPGDLLQNSDRQHRESSSSAAYCRRREQTGTVTNPQPDAQIAEASLVTVANPAPYSRSPYDHSNPLW